MKRLRILLLFIVSVTWLYCQNNNITIINAAYLHQDVSKLIKLSEAHPEHQKEIEDFLFTGIDYDRYTYEQILGFCKEAYHNHNNTIYTEFNRIKRDKEIGILKYISQLTAEQLVDYSQHFIEQKDIVDLYVNTAIYPSLDSLSYIELSYIERKSHFPFIEEIKRNKNNRKNEIKQIFQNEIDSYCDIENKQLLKLFYVLRYRSLYYLYSSFKQISQKYSNVEVPDYPSAMVEQFDNIMKSYLITQELNDILQRETKDFCEKINTNRSLYLQQINRPLKTALNIQIPQLHSFNYRYDMSYFHRIHDLKNELIQSQGTTSSWSGIIGLFTNWAGVGRALLDMGSISDEAQQEVQLRKRYISTVISSLEQSIIKHCNEAETIIKNEYDTNQKKFREYVYSNF